VLLGAFGGDHVFKRIAEYGDGWIPLNGFVPENWRAKLDDALAARGRKPSSVTTALASIFPGDDFAQTAVDQGFDRVIFTLPSEPRDKLLPLIEQYTATARRLGQVSG
jgi:alkanesulfonate monooxygenase SsuD/methylene tetrahydromethanopterin reductase-like flavin-dependent oxidoreductase (luciferase family)